LIDFLLNRLFIFKKLDLWCYFDLLDLLLWFNLCFWLDWLYELDCECILNLDNDIELCDCYVDNFLLLYILPLLNPNNGS
jgi:hypothetical protein